MKASSKGKGHYPGEIRTPWFTVKQEKGNNTLNPLNTDPQYKLLMQDIELLFKYCLCWGLNPSLLACSSCTLSIELNG